jgi:hypothetical protein
MGLILGGVTFADFEVPSSIAFGGDQTVAVHRLQGGARVVDTLGPDDGDIRWRGIISGGDATSRAQMLDQLRISGSSVPLTWDSFCYTVIITELHFSFNNSWWIPYEIRCVVADDPSIQSANVVTSVLSAVTTDLANAGVYVDVSAVTAAVTMAGSAGAGSTAYATAGAAITTAYQIVTTSLQSSGSLDTADIGGVVSAAAGIAALGAARGYLARAAVNYALVG